MSRRHRSFKATGISFAALSAIAAQVANIPGMELQRSSGLWRNQGGTYTGRFVFRPLSRDDRVQSIVVTIRNLELAD